MLMSKHCLLSDSKLTSSPMLGKPRGYIHSNNHHPGKVTASQDESSPVHLPAQKPPPGTIFDHHYKSVSMLSENARKIGLVFMCLFIASALLLGQATQGYSSQPQEEKLFSMSLEELMDLEIISAFKKPQNLRDTPAAVFVITQDDIRRSGASTIPDLLRMVPGVNVAKVDNSNWAISIRGFNGLFSNKLLVLMDGRTVYDPLFSGVFWDVQDTMLEDIERIEIIRGPGASSWGTNAVNGVINIITKNAWNTQGGLVSGSTGNWDRYTSSARYGIKIGETGAARLYVKAFERASQDTKKGTTAWDANRMMRSGFHSDWKFSQKDSATIQGDIYTEDGTTEILGFNSDFSERMMLKSDILASGGNVLSRWRHSFNPASNISFQFYYDHIDRKFSGIGKETRDTLDFEFQHSFPLLGFNDLLWGCSYRHTWDDIPIGHGKGIGQFIPQSMKDDLFGLFVQNEMGFFQDRLRFLFGLRLDHNNYTGLETEPTARVIYTITNSQDIWLALSKAVRIPSRYNRGAIWAVGVDRLSKAMPPTVFTFIGDDDYGTEKLWAVEAGYRWNACKKVSVDLALFGNFYRDLFVGTGEQPFFHHGLIIAPISPNNYGNADNFGLEITGNLQPFHWWRLELAYSYLNTNYWIDSRHRSQSELLARYMEAPSHQVSARSKMNLTEQLEFDIWLRYVSDLDKLDVPAYTGLDLRLGYHLPENLELSVAAKDLLDPYHPEYGEKFLSMQSTEIPRSVDAKLTWKF